jgi:hypothetical protein
MATAFAVGLSPVAHSAHTDAVPEDDDRARDASSGADNGRARAADADTAWADEVAPDDISALSRDIKAYRREQRAARRRLSLRRLFARPAAAPLTMAATALALAGAIAIALTQMDPDPANRPAALPIAAHPSAAVGATHGLIPNVSLQTGSGATVMAQTLRPSVLALIPTHCNCVPLLQALSNDVHGVGPPLIVVAPGIDDAEADSLNGQFTGDQPAIYYDPNASKLAHQIGSTTLSLTLVMVNRDGTIFDKQTSVTSAPGTHLTALAHQMLGSKATSG